jgi:hypothetical protein
MLVTVDEHFMELLSYSSKHCLDVQHGVYGCERGILIDMDAHNSNGVIVLGAELRDIYIVAVCFN